MAFTCLETKEAAMPIRTYTLLCFAIAAIAGAAPAMAQHQPPQAHHQRVRATMHSNVPGGVVAVPFKPERSPIAQKIIDPHLVPPAGPGPLHSDALHLPGNSRRIIFVGGHAALNPQPIPPGHLSPRPPHSIAPLSGRRDQLDAASGDVTHK
jgi:hypothetical protein